MIEITDEISDDIELVHRHGTQPPLLQVMTLLRFYTSGSIQDVCAKLTGIHQSTASRTITQKGHVFPDFVAACYFYYRILFCNVFSQPFPLQFHLIACPLHDTKCRIFFRDLAQCDKFRLNNNNNNEL